MKAASVSVILAFVPSVVAMAQPVPAAVPAMSGTVTQSSPSSAPTLPGPAAGPTVSADEPLTLEKSMSLRDPFRRTPPKVISGINEGGEVPELERFEVDKFHLVGVITGLRHNKAMLTDPSGKMHIVAEGKIIGNRRGLIKSIAPGNVVIQEKVVNLLGQEESVETSLRLESKQQRSLAP